MDTTVRAVTLNIWGRGSAWRRRLPLVRAEIARLAPDVVGLQEVWRRGSRCQAEQIADALGYHVTYAPAVTRLDRSVQGNALLSREPVTRHDVLPLPTPAGVEPRSVLRAETGATTVLVTHLTWEWEHAHIRQRQVRFLAELAARSERDVVVLADLNAAPDTEEVRWLTSRLADVWACAGGGPGHTFTPANGFARKDREPARRIDFVLSDGLRATHAELAFTTPVRAGLRQVWPSDHFGVVCDLAPAARPA
ncbi:endonuclease/exonuclease/phosphatase family protein [Streptomyces sp. NBC_00083]|uniref:endonuclease/exonuclease/phosphatase family protein n=1 Tax=Streptomyces sp. NBC_00083 TaxID=2975647 RepID=UPI00225A9A8B|nr:endonuclease/exonuclease/phosphatase family protein [Streptomyces sp. NBC_00083]MCX5384463.1 endonuclease/exonuclease/phosphatase family protein [Streptomyces sp. NBC_00083]